MTADRSAVTMPLWTTLPFISAARPAGVVRKRLSVPRWISSNVPMPAHRLEASALVTTTPGTR